MNLIIIMNLLLCGSYLGLFDLLWSDVIDLAPQIPMNLLLPEYDKSLGYEDISNEAAKVLHGTVDKYSSEDTHTGDLEYELSEDVQDISDDTLSPEIPRIGDHLN